MRGVPIELELRPLGSGHSLTVSDISELEGEVLWNWGQTSEVGTLATVLVSLRECNVSCPASAGKIAKWIQLLLQEGTVIAKVQGDTGTGGRQEVKMKQPESESLFFVVQPCSLPLVLPYGFQGPGMSTTSRNGRMNLELGDDPSDFCFTPQDSYEKSKSVRKKGNERIKGTFIYKPLEIIITLVRVGIYSEISY